MELEERVARGERHPRDVGDVPGAHDDPARVGVFAKEPHDLRDLVDVPAVRRRPAAPLHAVDRAELAVLVGPLVPDRDAVLLQPAHVRVAAQEPEELDATDLKCTFFVVTSGKPSARSKRIW